MCCEKKSRMVLRIFSWKVKSFYQLRCGSLQIEQCLREWGGSLGRLVFNMLYLREHILIFILNNHFLIFLWTIANFCFVEVRKPLKRQSNGTSGFDGIPSKI